jgi:hypothetical protein
MASTDDPQRRVYEAALDLAAAGKDRQFTRCSQARTARILCLTALGAVATLIDEALSAGFADAASTAIPAHSEAKGNSLTGDLQRIRSFRRILSGLSGIAFRQRCRQQRVPWVRHRQEAEAGQGTPVSPEMLCTLLDKSLTSPIGAPGRRLSDTPHAGLVARSPWREMGRRRIRSWLLWQTPNILNKPRANP